MSEMASDEKGANLRLLMEWNAKKEKTSNWAFKWTLVELKAVASKLNLSPRTPQCGAPQAWLAAENGSFASAFSRVLLQAEVGRCSLSLDTSVDVMEGRPSRSNRPSRLAAV